MSDLKGLVRVQKKLPVNIFFLELIIVLLFFSVSGAVILKMFATADKLESKSSITESAVMDVQSAAEMYARNGDMRGAVEKLYGSGWYVENVDGSVTVFLDEMRQPLLTPDVREKYCTVSLTFSEQRSRGMCGEFCELTAVVLLYVDGGEEAYRQVSSAYIPDFERGAQV